MKKFRVYSILVAIAILGVVLYSCNKDNFSEEDAMNLQAKLDKQQQHDNDSINTKNYRVSYTINLVDASTSALKSTSQSSAIAGAVVKFVQDTMIVVKTADASGIVSISNAKPGNANVNIKLTDYSEVNYTVNLSSSSVNGGRQFSNIIPLIPVSGTSTGTISGKVTCESDLTNNAPEAAPSGTKVMAIVRTSSDALPSTGNNGIVSISYDNLSLNTTTDANGNYSLTVPATVNGLSYDIYVSDFSVSQKLLQDTYFNRDTLGVLSIPANFGSSYMSASSVSTGTPVIVSVSAPDYTFTPATATAVIDNSMSISYIQNTNVGSYYYKSTTMSYTIKNATVGGSDATVTLTVDGNGHINATINSGGSKFDASVNGTTITVPYIKAAAKAVVNTVDANGAITSYTVNGARAGEFYSTDNVQFVKQTGAGTGTVTTLPTTTSNGSSRSFNTTTVNLTTPVGTGFAANDSLVLTTDANKDNKYTGKIFVSNGTVTGINITNEGTNYISGKVDVVLSTPIVGGTQATATATVTNGKISSIAITNAGSGYLTAPTVAIVNKMEKVQAKFTATLSGGKVTALSPASAGSGYMAVPTVNILSAIPGQGTGASAYAKVNADGSVSLTLVNSGSGYKGNNPSSSKSFSGSTNVTVTGNRTIINNIDLGTGKRTIEQ